MANRFKPLTRDQLSKFLPTHELIKAFEKTIQAAGDSLPTEIDAISNFVPPLRYVGTLGYQDKNRVEIAGGVIGGLTSFGLRSSGAAFDLKFASAEALTADRTITYVVGNANRTISYFGNTTVPVFSQAVTFTGPTVARTITLPDANFSAARTDAGQTFTGTQTVSGGDVVLDNDRYIKGKDTGGTARALLKLDSVDNTHVINELGNRIVLTIGAAPIIIVDATTVDISAADVTTAKFGCNGAAAQGSMALGAAATDLASAITLVNNIRAALIANGIGS